MTSGQGFTACTGPRPAIGLILRLDGPGICRHVGVIRHAAAHPLGRNILMAWKTPRIVEVSLALEINSYACAEIG